MARAQSSDERLLSLLEGRRCNYCDDGQLERDTYKGTAAIVCEACETPVARIW